MCTSERNVKVIFCAVVPPMSKSPKIHSLGYTHSVPLSVPSVAAYFIALCREFHTSLEAARIRWQKWAGLIHTAFMFPFSTESYRFSSRTHRHCRQRKTFISLLRSAECWKGLLIVVFKHCGDGRFMRIWPSRCHRRDFSSLKKSIFKKCVGLSRPPFSEHLIKSCSSFYLWFLVTGLC